MLGFRGEVFIKTCLINFLIVILFQLPYSLTYYLTTEKLNHFPTIRNLIATRQTINVFIGVGEFNIQLIIVQEIYLLRVND